MMVLGLLKPEAFFEAKPKAEKKEETPQVEEKKEEPQEEAPQE